MIITLLNAKSSKVNVRYAERFLARKHCIKIIAMRQDDFAELFVEIAIALWGFSKRILQYYGMRLLILNSGKWRQRTRNTTSFDYV